METTTPRITPLQAPYEPDTGEMLKRWMPPGAAVEPLALFRTLAVHPELMSRMRPLGSGILNHGELPARDREIVLHRTCARAGAEYEWGVHAVAFGEAVGLTADQITATATATATATTSANSQRGSAPLVTPTTPSPRLKIPSAKSTPCNPTWTFRRFI